MRVRECIFAGPRGHKACERMYIKSQELTSMIQDLRTKLLVLVACLRNKQAFGETSKTQVPNISTIHWFSKF